MAILKDQIDALIGTGIVSTTYDVWIKAGARSIVDIMTPEDMASHSTSVTIPVTTGLTTAHNYRVYRVLVGGYEAKELPAGKETQVVDSNSLLKSSPMTPCYIMNAGTMKTYNGVNVAGTLLGVEYNTGVDSSADVEVGNIPDQLEFACILYAAIQGKMNQLATLQTNMASAISATLTTLPTPLVTTLDISTQLARLETYILTTEDIELAQVEIGQIQTLIANWLQNTAGEIKIELEQSVLKLNAELETMKSKIASYSQQVQAHLGTLQALRNEYNSLIQTYLGLLGAKQ